MSSARATFSIQCVARSIGMCGLASHAASQTPTFGTAPIRGSTGCLVLGLRCLIFVMGSACIDFLSFRPCFVHGPGILLVHSSFCPSHLGSSFPLEGWSLSPETNERGGCSKVRRRCRIESTRTKANQHARTSDSSFLRGEFEGEKKSRIRSACAGPEDPACFFGASTLQVPTLLLWMADGK